jgi:hypothetical protein
MTAGEHLLEHVPERNKQPQILANPEPLSTRKGDRTHGACPDNKNPNHTKSPICWGRSLVQPPGARNGFLHESGWIFNANMAHAPHPTQ